METTLASLARKFTTVLSFFLPAQANAVPLSAAARVCTQFTLDHAWADSILKNYRGIIAQFHSFCDSEQIHCCLLCMFTSFHVGSIAGSTAKSQMAALKAWYIYNNAP